MADKCLLFDLDTVSSRKFLDVVAPRLQHRGQRVRPPLNDQVFTEDELEPPFELECLEGAFLVAVGEAVAESLGAAHGRGANVNVLWRSIVKSDVLQVVWTRRWRPLQGGWPTC